MTKPRRRPLRRDNLHIETTLHRYTQLAPELELRIALLRQARRDAGWPTTTPQHDQHPTTRQPDEPSTLDYNDPTANLALRLETLNNDLETLGEHWTLVRQSLRAMIDIARRYKLPDPAIPACDVGNCHEHVEYTPSGGFRGMELIAGHWVAKDGVRPVCAKHRSAQRRDIA